MEGALPPIHLPRSEESPATPRLSSASGPPLASPQDGPRTGSARRKYTSGHTRPKPPNVRLRRFFFDELTHGVRPTLPLHYDVLLPSSRPKDTAQDHLRYRYVDFVCPTGTAWRGMLDGTDPTGDVDMQQLMEFFRVAEPRTRIDAYPMYILLRDILHRQLNGTLKLRHKEAEALRSENMQLRQQLQDHAERIADLEQQLSASGEQLRQSALVHEHKQKAEAALKQAERTLVELTTNKFKLAAYRAQKNDLKRCLEEEHDRGQQLEREREVERTQSEEAKWTCVDLEAMLTEALEERGPDDQTLEQAFLLLGEDNSKKLHLRMKRAHPTLFQSLTKYKYIFISPTNGGQNDGEESHPKRDEAGQPQVRSMRDFKQLNESEECQLQMRLLEGVGSEKEEAEIHRRLAHLDEEKMLQHEMEELRHSLRTADLSVEEEIKARERLHQLEGFERTKLKKDIAAQVSAGLMKKEDAHAELLSLDDADTMAHDHAELVAKIKSGKLSGEELSRVRGDLERVEHDKRLATVPLTERFSQEDTSLEGVEKAMVDLVHTADRLRRRLMDPNLTAAQRRKLEMDLEELENASEGTFQAAMKLSSDDGNEQMVARAQQLNQLVNQPGLSNDDEKRLHAELQIVQKAADDSSRRTVHMRSLYKQAAHSVLSQARSMKLIFGKVNRGLSDHTVMETTLQEKAGILAKVEGTVHEAADLRTVSHADLAAHLSKAELVSTGIYSPDELAKMNPAQVRQAMHQYAKVRQVGVVAATQTDEQCLGVRKVEECLSKFVQWDRNMLETTMEPKHDVSATNKKMKAGSKAEKKKATVAEDGHTVHKKENPLLRAPSYHSRALTNAEGISQAKPHSIVDIRERAAKLFHAKILQDKKMDGAMMRRTCLPDFIQESFINQYGLQTIATKHVHSFAAGVLANEKAEKPDRLVRILGRLAGIVNPQSYSSVEVNFVMDLLDLLFEGGAISRLSDALLKNLHVDGQLVGKKVDLLLTAYSEPWHADLMASLENHFVYDNVTCVLDGGHVAEVSPDGLLPLNDLLEVVLQHWDAYEEHRHKEFAAVFNKFDANNDQQLSLEEWEELIKSCDRQKWIADGKSEDEFEWDRPHKIVQKMFKIALNESRLDTQGAISLPAFITVAHVYRVIDDITPWERKNAMKIQEAAMKGAYTLPATAEATESGMTPAAAKDAGEVKTRARRSRS